MRLKIALLILLTLALGACGYRLQGTVDLPDDINKVYLQGASGSLRDHFTRTLRSSPVRIVDSIGQAELVINTLNEKLDRRVLSLSSIGKANEFELNYKLEYELLDNQGAVLARNQSVEIIREYYNDQEAVIAQANEEQVIINEMYKQAVRSILDRTRTQLHKY
ncbi:LPS assembly lipoprotein LptE [Methylotuvimicrobium sp. KM2]|uniref:LPS-assembly lipoprotein LptE n=1 Tax=Methylotuvimicrobium sp. KM2 TaxID=3133976 RepID=UPI003100CDED